MEFRKLVHRVLEAPTVAITHLLEDVIVEWFRDIGEVCASVWYRDNWTGEHGNYTNSTSGYVGNTKVDWNRIPLQIYVARYQ
jgi:hypothetical protein